MIPDKASATILRWFKVVAELSFARHNWHLFMSSGMPCWLEKDSRLAQRVQTLELLASVVGGEDMWQDLGHLSGLFDPFADFEMFVIAIAADVAAAVAAAAALNRSSGGWDSRAIGWDGLKNRRTFWLLWRRRRSGHRSNCGRGQKSIELQTFHF